MTGGIELKRFRVMLCAFLLILGCFAAPRAGAASVGNYASSVELYCTVNSDGDCLVSMTVNLHLEDRLNTLQFPLPGTATDITMNGSNVFTSRSGDIIQADISRAIGTVSGDIPLRFDYKLPKAVGVVKVGTERRLQLSLPMLCGFSYPVDSLSFIITLPGTIESKPSFTSTYQQTGFESNLELVTNGNLLTGASLNTLNDHERVDMTLLVPTDMFPSVSLFQREGNPEIVPMAIVAAIALLYWLLFLRNFPLLFQRATVPPEGITAGELNCRVTMSGGDLTMMVLSWAQMGYLQIQLDGSRVWLHKRMDMGNERSLFEIRVYQSLFQKRRSVDCTGSAYAKLCAKTAAMVPGEKAMCRPISGSRKVFRVLLCVAQAICGVCVAMNITSISLLQWLFAVIFALLSAVSAWLLQEFALTLRSRHKTLLWVDLGICLFWVLLGALGSQPWIPLAAVAVQLLCSFLVAYGGIRTELNRSDCGEIQGLKRYLRHLQPADAKRLLLSDPEYFFRMAPYAMALGVSKPFARAFGRRKLVQCPYFITRVQGKRTAVEWMSLMTKAVAIMDDRWQRSQKARWLAVRFR